MNLINALYEEFLNHHGLNNGLIYRVVLSHERIFKDVPKLSFVRIGNQKVFVNESVNNAVAFSKQIHLAKMNVDQALLPFFKSVYPNAQVYTGIEDAINLLRILSNNDKKTGMGSIRFFDSENETLKSVYHSFFNLENKL